MTARPWMPLYIADYLADTAHLGALQSGAYLHLIMHYWQTGGLPGDDAALMRIARLTVAEWRRNCPMLAAFFHDGWKHKRIDDELAHASDVSSKRRASAEQRHSKRSANAPAKAEQLDTHARGLSQPQSQDSRSLRERDTREKTDKPVSRLRKQATRLPENFEPDLGEALALGLSLETAMGEAAKFKDHFAGAPGQRGVKQDWPATWRNWCRRSVTDMGVSNGPRPGNGRGGASRDPHEPLYREIARQFATGDGADERPPDADGRPLDHVNGTAEDSRPALELPPAAYRRTS